jgi:hypothetical protein
MTQDGSDEVFENDLDRLSRDANPGTIVTGAFLQDPESSNDSWRESHAALFAELEAAHNEATNEKDLSVHISSHFPIHILTVKVAISNPTSLFDPSLFPLRNTPNVTALGCNLLYKDHRPRILVFCPWCSGLAL